jgi:hypothetical protein
MIIRTKISLNNTEYEFEVDEKSEMETLNKAITLSNPPTCCTVCKNSDKSKFKFTSNKDKEGNIYVNIKCICGAKAKLGLYKTGGFFWHREFKVYVKDQSKEELS